MQYSEGTTGYAVLRGHHWVCSAQSGPLGIQCSQCSGGTTGYAVLNGDHWVCSAQGGPLGMQCSGGTTGYAVLRGDTTGYAVLRGDHWVYAVRGHHWVCSTQRAPLGMQYSEDTTGYAVLRVDLWVFSARSAQGGPLGICSAQGGPLGIWRDLCMKCSEGMQGLYACRGYVHCHSTMAWESIIDTYFGSLSAIATLIAAKSITAFCLHRQYRTACTSLTHAEGIQQAQMSLSISYVHQNTQWCHCIPACVL